MRYVRRLMLIIIILFVVLTPHAFASAKVTNTPRPTPSPTPYPYDPAAPTYNPDTPDQLIGGQLIARAAMLVNQDTGATLFTKNPDVQMYPASTTKIMTLLIALEKGNLKDIVTIPEEAKKIPQDSSIIPVEPGETMTLYDLCVAFMIRSGNDGANAIAMHIAGSLDAFVEMMNAKAEELGMTGTHYTNAHGYPNENHYTTARDMAHLTIEAMRSANFRRIVAIGEYTLPANSVREEPLKVYSANQFVVKDNLKMEYAYAPGTGVKTGYSNSAGYTFVGSASKDGTNLISVVLFTTPDGRWTDATRLMDYGFAISGTYSPIALYRGNVASITVPGYALDDPQNGRLLLNIAEKNQAKYAVNATKAEMQYATSHFLSMITLDIDKNLQAPIEQNQVVGTLIFTPVGQSPMAFTLIAARSVAARENIIPTLAQIWDRANTLPNAFNGESISSMRFLVYPAIGFVALIVALMTLRAALKRRRERKKREAVARAYHNRTSYGYSAGYHTSQQRDARKY